MKRVFVVVCLACICSFFSKNASAYHPIPSIPLKGTLAGGGPIRTPPVDAYQNATGVEVVFNIDLGKLTVEVINETGDTVFQSTVHSKAGVTLAIDTIGWESGEYILLIMDEEGGYLEGNFVID